VSRATGVIPWLLTRDAFFGLFVPVAVTDRMDERVGIIELHADGHLTTAVTAHDRKTRGCPHIRSGWRLREEASALRHPTSAPPTLTTP